jgi:5-methylcytosine-specific restriction endonuclease McrA
VLVARVLAAAGYRCAYCSIATATTGDHVVPHSKGGRSDERNTVAACRTCNTSKGNRTLREWVASGRAPLPALQLLAARIRSELPV